MIKQNQYEIKEAGKLFKVLKKNTQKWRVILSQFPDVFQP